MKKVLVTGATGFTGGHLYNTLLDKDYDVTALIRKNSVKKFIEKFGESASYIIGDLSDPKSIEGKIFRVKFQIHLQRKMHLINQEIIINYQNYKAKNLHSLILKKVKSMVLFSGLLEYMVLEMIGF